MNQTTTEQGAAPWEKKRRKRGMTNWYNPQILVTTAIRVAISGVFGQFADRREAIAASNAIEPQPFDKTFNYSDGKGDFWFDYLADTGDGWDSTYAMARLVSEDSISPPNHPGLPRGKLLLLGGDQVYPFASKEDYDERFLAPFDQAYCPGGKERWKEGDHELYAIPGNHDWYDGLNAFFGLFCRRRVKPKDGIGSDRRGRMIAGRQTHQTRSYFAIQLPGNWWLWGTDAQLEGYIDQPQIEFFQHVAQVWMREPSKLILLVDGPSWAYVEPDDPSPKFENFSYLERLVGFDAANQPTGHELKLVLTGDSHHYSRYTEADRTYITCGGGGAFLHPTHHLKDKCFNWKYPPPGQRYTREDRNKIFKRHFKIANSNGKEGLFPGRKQSRMLSLWNLAFAIKNYPFTLTLFAAYFVFHWLLNASAQTLHGQSLAQMLETGDFEASSRAYWQLVFATPTAILLTLVAAAAYYYAAGAPPFIKRFGMGLSHALLQAIAVTATICATMRFLPPIGAVGEILLAALLAAPVSATVYGLYLLLWVNVSSWHWNEGFSSFAHRGFKGFLRLKIERNGRLTIYPVGLEKTPRDRSDPPKDPPLKPHLIEEPIVIG